MKYGINAINTILPADEVYNQSEVAVQEREEANVARLINYNANHGESISIYVGSLSDTTISKLTDNGYDVQQKFDQYGQPVKYVYVIKRAVV